MTDKLLGGASPSDVGKRIQEARNRRSLTVAQLGERIGVSHVTILSVEKGEKLSRQTLVALAKELNDDFSVTWLQEHLEKYHVQAPNFYDAFENKIRLIVRDELEKAASPIEENTFKVVKVDIGKLPRAIPAGTPIKEGKEKTPEVRELTGAKK